MLIIKGKIRQYHPIRDLDDLISQLNAIRERLSCKGEFRLKEVMQLAANPKYQIIKIPKKKNGYRVISIPNQDLAFLQHCLKNLMYQWYKPNDYTFGFIQQRSIVDNAKIHITKDIIYNMDLKNFFDSISFDDIVEKLIRPPYSFSYKVSKLIAEITTVPQFDGNRILPQGAPSSPIFTNIICNHLDIRLSTFCEKHNISYSRYVDDLCFSFESKVLQKWEKGNLKSIITEIITSEGFEINKKKTRISFKNQRHEVTGLIVNQKVNVNRNYLKHLRTELHNWEKDGYVIASYKFLRHIENKGKSEEFHPKPMERVLSGKISFLKLIKGDTDPTYKKYKERLENLVKRDSLFLTNSTQKRVEERNIFNINHSQLINKNYKKNKDNTDEQWHMVYHRFFSKNEISMVLENIVVKSQYGKSVKFKLNDGRTKFIPLSISSHYELGENINVSKSVIMFLSKGKKKIIRIE